jgi:glycosyltransferase involved in cell wall biosynthesis
MRQLYTRTLITVGNRRSSAVICVSFFTENELIRLAGVDRSKINVIHLGVAPAWFQITAEERPHINPYILCVGNVKPHKNLSMLLKAFQKIANEIPHDVMIVGKKDGFLTGDADVLHQALNLGERVRFTGYVDDNSLKQFFIHADALLFPSLYEGFGLPPLEAMASGIPAAVARAASIPEVCGDAVLYFDPRSVDDIAEKILTVVRDQSLRQHLIERGKLRAAEFSWETCAEKTAGLIRSILQETHKSTIGVSR